MEDGVLDGSGRLWIYQHSFYINCSGIHGLCLAGKVSTLFSLGEAEGRTVRIDLALAELWSWEVHYARWTWSSPPWDCRWKVLTRLLMTRVHFFFARVSTGPPPRPSSPPHPHCVDLWGVAGHWSMQNLSTKKIQCTCAALRSQELTECRRNADSGPQTWDLWATLHPSSKVELHSSSLLELHVLLWFI